MDVADDETQPLLSPRAARRGAGHWLTGGPAVTHGVQLLIIPPAAGGREEDFPGAGAEMLRVGAWVGLILCGWLLQKGLCELGLPSDCDGVGRGYGAPWANGWLGHVEGLQILCTRGAVAGWLLGVQGEQRHHYLFFGQLLGGGGSDEGRRRWPRGWFVPAYLLCIAGFSALMTTKTFTGNVERGVSLGRYKGLYVLDGLGTGAALALTAWHIGYGLRHCGGCKPFAFGFLLPRAAVFG
jgi:hypothetical protein